MTSLRKVSLVGLVLAILVWVGVGIYYLTTKSPEAPSSIGTLPIPTPTPATSAISFQFPGIPKISDTPPDTKAVEGLITKTEPGGFDLKSGGQTYTFFLDQNSRFIFPEESEGVVVGEGMKVYYKEKDDKLYVINGIGAMGAK